MGCDASRPIGAAPPESHDIPRVDTYQPASPPLLLPLLTLRRVGKCTAREGLNPRFPCAESLPGLGLPLCLVPRSRPTTASRVVWRGFQGSCMLRA